MGSNAIVQATVDSALRDQAVEVLAEIGMTLDEAVRMLLIQVVEQRDMPLSLHRPDPNMPGAPPYGEIGEGKRFASYDDWFRSEVEVAIREADDPNCVWIPHEEVSRKSATLRADLLQRMQARKE
jgi:addiction module RelB/DinJ family antitoxin